MVVQSPGTHVPLTPNVLLCSSAGEEQTPPDKADEKSSCNHLRSQSQAHKFPVITKDLERKVDKLYTSKATYLIHLTQG